MLVIRELYQLLSVKKKTHMSNWDSLKKRVDLAEVAQKRNRKNVKKSVPIEQVELEQAKGWTLKTRHKSVVSMEKPKEIGDAFEDEVWMVFYKMGFDYMNSDRKFNLSYSSANPGLTKQIDVIAIDEECCIFVECKTTNKIDREKQWKTEIEAINGYYQGICNEITSKFGKRKFKYIFATKNYIVGESDRERIKSFRFAYFDEDSVRYYDDLAYHLGAASKYQLLGNLFSGQEITGMDMRVPAIEGKMGDHTYYSFSIEPKKLLKIAYVLHRNNANHELMPTYQRLIQKSRLNAIQKYVNEGGFFPNSLIVSIDSGGKRLQFDRANTQVDNSISRVGVLHLPKKYQSAYIIDGQHRLYGYSGSSYESNNSIPVVAFVDLKKEAQLKMFMDINEHQKAVPKSLRNTLSIDMDWSSEVYKNRNVALMLYIAEKFGEDSNSPLYKRVITGENNKTSRRCITTETIRLALEKTIFLNKYKIGSNTLLTQGCFDEKGDNDKTKEKLLPFLIKAIDRIREGCKEEWNKDSEGYVTINNCIYAIIVIISDCVKIVLEHKGTNIVSDQKEVLEDITPFLQALSKTIMFLSEEDRNTIKTEKGAGGPVKAYNTLRVALNKEYKQFNYPELEEYIKENCTNHNPQAQDLLTRLLYHLRDLIEQRYPNENEWLRRYVPEALAKTIVSNQAQEAFSENREVKAWQVISFSDIATLASYKTNWSDFYKGLLTFEGVSIKDDALSWLKEMAKYYSAVSSNRKITNTEYQKIKKVANAFGIE